MDSLYSNITETIENSRILIWQSKKLMSLAIKKRQELCRAEEAAWRAQHEARNTIAYSKKQKDIDVFPPNAK